MTKPTEEQRKWALKLAKKLKIPFDDVIERYFGDDEPDSGSGDDYLELCEDLLAQLDYAVPEDIAPDELVPGALPSEVSALLDDVAEMRTEIRALKTDYDKDFDDVNAYTPRVNGVPARLSGIRADVARRIEAEQAEHTSLTKRFGEQTECGVTKGQIARFTAALAKVGTELERRPISADNNAAAAKALEDLDKLRAAIETETEAMGGTDKAGALDTAFGDDLDAIATAIGGAAALGKLLTTFDAGVLAALITQLGGAATGANALKDTIAAFGNADAAKAALDDLGADGLSAMVASGTAVGDVARIYTGLGGAAMKALFGADNNLDRADTVLTGFGGDTATFLKVMDQSNLKTQPDALLALLDKGADGNAGAFATLMNSFDSDEKRSDLGGLLDAGGLGACPDVLGALAKGASADGLIAFGEEFRDPGPRAALNKALTDGGLGAAGTDTGCLAKLLDKPGEDDKKLQARSLAELLSGLTDDSRGQMKSMLDTGGLGAAPDGLAALVHTGCEAKASALNALLNATNTDEGRSGMKELMTNAGMDGSVKGGAGCLAQILQDSGTDDTTRATGFAGLVSGIDATIAGDLKKVLDTGGMAGHPKVLGKLVAEGCGGKATDLGALSAGIAASATAQANLKGLVDKGGFGAKVDGGDDTGTEPECLAELFKTGCEGNPAKLVPLLEAMGATQQTQMCAMMKDGDLGKHPKVLANMYKHGCLADGQADKDGNKDPEKLKKVLAAFDGKDALFKDMMGAGGFGTAGKETRLGSVLRYGFTDKTSGVAAPEKLEQMATSFNGNMVNLNTMLDAMETAPAHAMLKDPDQALQPGGGIQNILASPKHNGSARQLKRDFYDKLTVASPALPSGSTQAANRPLNELIQTAASFEHEPVPAATTEYTSRTGTKVDIRADHILGRHTRKYKDFEVKDHNTLFPVGMDAAAIDTAIENTVTAMARVNGRGGNRSNNFTGGGIPRGGERKKVPPQDVYDLRNGSSAWSKDAVPIDGDTYTVKIAFKPSSTSPKVMVDQFFPDENSHAKIEDINRGDMHKIRRALT